MARDLSSVTFDLERHGLSESTYGHIVDEDVMNHLEPIFNEYENCLEMHYGEEEIQRPCFDCLKKRIYRVFKDNKELKEAKELLKTHPSKSIDVKRKMKFGW